MTNYNIYGILIIERDRKVVNTMTDRWIWLDMDGTIADLYSVDGWLEDLIAHNTRPYAKAKDLYNIFDLLEVLVELKLKGYKLGIISWGSKENNAEYDKAVEKVKREWLANRLLDNILDKIIVFYFAGISKKRYLCND